MSIIVTSFGSICLIAQLKRFSSEVTFCCLRCTVCMYVCDQKRSALFSQMGLVKMENVPCVSGKSYPFSSRSSPVCVPDVL